MTDDAAIAVKDIEAVVGTMIVIEIVGETMIVGVHVNGVDHVRDHLAIDQGARVHQKPTFMVGIRNGFCRDLGIQFVQSIRNINPIKG